ncbi:DUF2170 family protein [Sinobacterium caligoides]|uniref:DUF2170 family protein n=1 Tax=Sinobacterium caligoides TaxID=933926 RepID=UPI001B86544F|nr:DUF2170 family protein [Sinobacterium caligoides]
MNIHNIANHLNNLGDKSYTGLKFDCYPIEGDGEALMVNITGREEVPVSVTQQHTRYIS